MTANSAGWTTSTRSSDGASSGCLQHVVERSTSPSVGCQRSAAHWSMRSAKTGEVVEEFGGHAGPLGALAGEDEHRAVGGAGAGARDDTAAGSPSASASSAGQASSSRSAPRTTARCRRAAAGGQRPADVGRAWPARCGEVIAAGRPGRAALRRRAGTTPRHHATGSRRTAAAASPGRRLRRRSATAPSAGACSRMTCALVPLIAERGHRGPARPVVSGQGRVSVSSSTAPADQSTCGDGSSTCRVLGQHAVPHAPGPS